MIDQTYLVVVKTGMVDVPHSYFVTEYHRALVKQEPATHQFRKLNP